MKHFLALASLFLLTRCVFFQATSVPENNTVSYLSSANSPHKEFIVFLGDSITHGRVSYDYVDSLTRHPYAKDYILVNEGINSRLTYQILEQLENVVKLKPKFVFLLIGTNDLKASLSEEEAGYYFKKWDLKETPTKESFTKNVNTIVDYLKKNSQAKIVLFSIPVLGEDPESIPFQRSIEYSKLLKEIGSSKKVTYKPFNEQLVQAILTNNNPNPSRYEMNRWGMYSTIIGHYVFYKSWDELSDKKGMLFLTDNIHLNARAGKILESMILEELKP